MKIAKCLNRHYYDKDKFFECPICKKSFSNAFNEMNSYPTVSEAKSRILDDGETLEVKNYQYGDTQTVVMDDNIEQTMVLDDSRTQVLDND